MPEEREESFAERALSHVDALFRLARRLTRRDADAEDLVQETFARAFGKHSQFERGTNLKAWLLRILRNTYIDAYRRELRTPVRTDFDQDTLLDVTATNSEPLRGDMELERLRRVVAEDIETALATLSEDARTIILLDLEGLTESEISEVLGCAAGTVKSRLWRARAALRQKLGDYASEAQPGSPSESKLKSGGRKP
jgi:RNA polymerase sigma-70 factor (ECF subfamily)